MEIAPESTGPGRDDPVSVPLLDELELVAAAPSAVVDQPLASPARRRRAVGRRGWSRTSVATRRELLLLAAIYLGVRVLLIADAALNSKLGHHDFLGELANWDGLWYRELANHGYPTHVSHGQTTLGFFPLYPMAIWALKQPLLLVTGHDSIWCATVAGVLISGVGGLVATLLVQRLAEGWWDRATARRATILFIVFPGSVVFSMVYSEGLLLPFAAGCIYLLQRRRWVGAGLLAGLASATQPAGLMLPVVCAVSALLELGRLGWRSPAARRSLLAPALSVTGAAAFALFLWAWTGSPLANYIAQHHGWSEKTDLLAVLHMAERLAAQVNLSHFNQPTINLNLVVGVIGSVVLVMMLALVFACRREISPEALVWTAAVSFLALTSEFVPPNPRMLITAFPALMVVGRWVGGRAFRVLVALNLVALVVMSWLTFYGQTLRP